MTLSVLGKVPTGFILACDRIQSPPGMSIPDPSREPAASRIFLSPERPLGILIWGAGSLGSDISAEIAAALGDQEKGQRPTIRQIAHNLAQSLAQKGQRKFADLLPYLRPRIGFFLAGFEAEDGPPTDWAWDMNEAFSPPRSVRTDRPGEPQYGFNWRGLDLWLTRLLLGYDPSLLHRLGARLAVSEEQLLPLFREVELPFSYSGMDLEQATEMARFMIHTTLGLLHLQTYPRSFSWEIEMAIITPQGAFWASPPGAEGRREEE